MIEETENKDIRDLSKFDSEIFENISTLIENQADKNLLSILADLHPADLGEIINHLDFEDAVYTFKLLDHETAGEVLTELDENLREKLLAEIETDHIVNIVDQLDSDDATDIVSDLPEQIQEHVLDKIDKEYSEDVKQLLKYPEDSAGGIMNSDFIFVYESQLVKDAIEEVRKNAEEIDNIYYIYVLKDDHKLVGTVSLKSLLTNPLDKPLSGVMEEDLLYVTPDVDQEEVARIIEKYDLVAIPVVDENMIMLGRITIDDVVDVINEEASEDLQRIAGLSEEEEYSDSSFRISRIRLPWLVVALIGQMLSAVVLASFEASLEKMIIATFFIPIVMAMGGSTGTQAAIVMVKSLTESEFWISDSFSRLFKEFRVALINATVCGAILLLVSHFFFENEIRFSFVLTVALFVIMTNATMVGAIIPIGFKKFGVDPAIATGPFVTTMNDILGLIIYLTLVSLFLVQ
ncbi:MAG: magnesium transporter [Melioribacteraceae bacterium]|nr:MAG: magnesium transporter [Melioribacteraceae bacterium]